ncbi:formate dehydrogenase subunit gamma [Paracraurococcus lichenis]|uniref:Formate dehydrogenase subunit gamma n=1 Tax=Paracraurococcus lichenis TaxID=3064888 RepID=A0ABT9DWA7_9PROT|nr:formate dehydrogenase subunit gamma [Paracraurococcus sp. LOR1-02]MDO9708186.1 formate dehydrogenase subunit gamma [Paracraurococcus sp. LOR1-02]
MTRILLAALLALSLAGGAARAQAPASGPGGVTVSAEEMELQRMLRGGRIEGRVSIPDARAASLVQPQGQAWREFHNRTLAWVGGVAVLGVLALLLAFFLAKGRIPIAGGPAGRTITRFSLLEWANHWMVASCFIILGLTGLNLTFGRHLLLPLIGPEGFTALTIAGKYAHNYLAFPFTLGVVAMLLLWARDNIPNARDIDWVRLGGGFIGRGHPEAGRFNAGQKMVFWITVLGGGLVAASGYMLIFPFAVTDIAGMQLAHMVHGIIAVLMIAAMLAHIYIGSVGMEGAVEAMSTGEVDLNWAKEHHGLWVQEVATAHRAPPPAARAYGAD